MPGSANRLDWTVTQICKGCGWEMRPSSRLVSEAPNTRSHSRDGYCVNCVRAELRRKRRRAKELAEGLRQPTVRELWEQGHPCIEPCPLPSRKESRR